MNSLAPGGGAIRPIEIKRIKKIKRLKSQKRIIHKILQLNGRMVYIMKISNQNLDKILERCTKKEIDLIIFLGQFQDDFGVVKGIHYKDVLNAIGISKSTFYKLLYGLEDKGIIEICWINEDFSYWSATIIDNVFDSSINNTQSNDYKKGYFKLNYAILHTKAFKSMTKSEKVIVIRLLKIADFSHNTIKVTIKTLMEWTNKSRRSVKKFVETLKSVFKISHPLQNLSLLLINKSTGFCNRLVGERDFRNRHLIGFALKRFGIHADAQVKEQDVKDCITVFKQYKVNDADAILMLLNKSIGQFGTLMPAHLNKVTRLFVDR